MQVMSVIFLSASLAALQLVGAALVIAGLALTVYARKLAERAGGGSGGSDGSNGTAGDSSSSLRPGDSPTMAEPLMRGQHSSNGHHDGNVQQRDFSRAGR